MGSKRSFMFGFRFERSAKYFAKMQICKITVYSIKKTFRIFFSNKIKNILFLFQVLERKGFLKDSEWPFPVARLPFTIQGSDASLLADLFFFLPKYWILFLHFLILISIIKNNFLLHFLVERSLPTDE